MLFAQALLCPYLLIVSMVHVDNNVLILGHLTVDQNLSFTSRNLFSSYLLIISFPVGAYVMRLKMIISIFFFCLYVEK